MECTNRLRELRESKDLKRHELAVEMDVDPATIYRWETGKGPISDENKLRLAEFFGVTPQYVMGWDREEANA